MWIITQGNSGSRQVIVFATKLLFIEALEGFVIDPADGVTVGEHHVAIGIRINAEHRGFAEPAGLQKQTPSGDLWIFFFSAKPGQEGHGDYGAVAREVT